MKKELRGKIVKWGTRILFILPLILGVIGYLIQCPGDYLDALYNAIGLYGLGFNLDFCNPWLEVARWAAPAATFSFLLVAIQSLSQRLANWWKLLHADTVAIYGSGAVADSLENDIQKKSGRKVIRGKRFAPAHTHVLMQDSDEATLQLFSQYLEHFRKGDRVYLKLEDFDPNALNSGGVDLYPFSLSDLTAQFFWRERAGWMCERCSGGEAVKLCLIGEGIYSEKMLTFGLLQNIYSLDQQVEYHLFGDWREFQTLHFDWHGISSPKDRVVFHDGPWFEALELLRQADMIVLCDGDPRKNLHIAQRLYSLLPQCELYLRLEDDRLLQSSIMPGDIHCFGGCTTLCTEENILQERLIASARRQHDAYRRSNPDSGIAPWEELDAFTRQSNISSSTFQDVNLPLLQARLAGMEAEERGEILTELEHIRWCRYHYLHNWAYAPGKKDRARRTHADLVPYAQLSRAEQVKDREALAH